ncbi:MAG: thioredoxin [Oscillospiraceae bacterium]|nr:thioredoxin [Oscillospiraceae bacterium]
MSKLILNDENEFNEKVLNSGDTVLVDFFAYWCGPCQMLAPLMEEIAEEGHKVYKVNVDEASALAEKYGIVSIPCVIAFEGGKEKDRIVGVCEKEELIGMVS